MSPEEVKKLINELKIDIENNVGWEEDWHAREDNIIWKVICDVANGNPKAKELAEEVKKTIELDFERFYT